MDSKLLAALIVIAIAAAAALAGAAAGWELARRRARPAAPMQDQDRLAWLQRLSTSGQMMSGVVHEVRTPLNTVILNIELAERSAARGEEVGERLKLALREADRAVEILSDILDFGKPYPLDLQPLELRPLLAAALEPLASRFDERGVATSLVVPDGLRVNASERHFHQVVTILLLNSLDALPFGGKLEIVGAREGAAVRVTVADNGLGIAPEVLERLFQPFATGHPDSGGTGLGLTVARWIMSKHGGDVTLSSPGIGRGTIVNLVLPCADAPNPDGASSY
jgi:signal transduction histidine kinase